MVQRIVRLSVAGFSTGLLAAGPTTQPAFGQAAETAAGGQIEEVIVTAARLSMPANALPNRVTLIDRDALAEQLAISSSTLDALGVHVPSFSPTRQKLSGFGESMRGREPLYMIDGVPQSNPLRNGSRDGFTLDPAVIERVEVLYGANAIQGIGATGGIVNYVTRSAATEGTRYELGTTMAGSGEGDGYGARTSVTTAKRWSSFDLVASVAAETRGAFYDADGRRVGVDNVQGDIQDSESLNAFAKLGWQVGDRTRAQAMLNVFELEGDGDYVTVDGDPALGIPTSAVRGSFPGVPPVNDVMTASFDVSHALRGGASLDAQLYLQDFESVFGGGTFAVFQDPAIDPTGQLFDQSSNNSEKQGLKLSYTSDALPIEGLTATAGIDYLADTTYQELIHTGRNWVPETEFRSVAPFVQLHQSLADDRLHLSGGVRAEIMTLEADTYLTLASSGPQTVEGGSPDFDESLLNVGISYDASDAVTVYGSFAEGFTVPDVGRVLRGVATPGASVETLLNLQPIVADNTEVGLKWGVGRLSGDVAYFWSESDFGQRLQADADGIFSVLRERTEIEGLEVAAAFDFSEAVAVGFNYASIDGEYDADADGIVDTDLAGVNISPDRLNVYAEWSPRDRLRLRLQSSTFFDRSFDDPGTASDFDGYSLLDTVVGWDLRRGGRLDFAVQNLLDEQYITYYSQSGGGGAADYFAGRGRTVTLRWSGVW